MISRISRLALALSLVSSQALFGCVGPRVGYATTDSKLALSRVVLYRNGVGYSERRGRVDGDMLVLRVRKDQVNDLLKSLTIVDRASGRAVSVSMPLDPKSWANAALATLAPGRGSLHEVLDALRGAEVSLTTAAARYSGRVVLVEQVERTGGDDKTGAEIDYKITLLDGGEFNVVRLSAVESVALKDGELALQFHRSLDASAGEGMFQQVDVGIRLAGARSHDLSVSYVVAAPIWKPTYRIVLPEKGKGKALLQGWAVVDNTSGEDWRDVSLSLTSGAPIAFRYDLHTPRDIGRADLSEIGAIRQARASVGEASLGAPGSPPEAAAAPAPSPSPMPEMAEDEEMIGGAGRAMVNVPRKTKGPSQRAASAADRRPSAPPPMMSPPKSMQPIQAARPAAPVDQPEAAMAIDVASLQKSALASSRSRQVSGLVQFDLTEKVTLPDGTSTMVAVVNQEVDGEETFLFRPGGAGNGFETNPYRVVRFKNTTPFVLEPGPISIYASGSFVGEGLSEAVGTQTSATIPFAVEPNIFVTSAVNSPGEELRLTKIVRGVLEVESFGRQATTWEVRLQKRSEPLTLLVRQSRAGSAYTLEPRPEGTEDLPEAYLIPIKVAAGAELVKLTVNEQTPSQTTITIWDSRALPLLELLLSTDSTPEVRKKIAPIVSKRQEIGRIDTMIDGLKQQQSSLDERASVIRQNLREIEQRKDSSPNALKIRRDQTARLEGFTKDGDKLARDIVDLQTKRLENKIALDDLLQNLDLTPTKPVSAPKK